MASAGNGTATLYAKLQDRYLARDQVGATGVFHELVKAGRPIAELLGDAMNQFTTLVRKETQLACAEMSEKLGDLALGMGLLVGGAVLLIPALVILLEAAVNGLIEAGIVPAWAALIGGIAALAMGGALLALGISRLRAARPVPTRTIVAADRTSRCVVTSGTASETSSRSVTP